MTGGVQFDPSYYPLPVADYKETTVPYWDTFSTVLSTAATPIKLVIGSCRFLWNFRNPKIEPPGPPGHHLLGSYPELKERDFDLIRFLTDVNAKYGKEHGICKVSFGTRILYIVTDPELVSEIFKKPSAFVRGPSLRVWQDKFSAGGLSEGQATQQYRTQAMNAIGEGVLPVYFPGMSKICQEWLKRLERYETKVEAFDLMHEAERAGLAAVGETLFHNDKSPNPKNPFGVGTDDDKNCDAFLKAFHTIFDLLSMQMTSGLANIPYYGDQIYSFVNHDKELRLSEAKWTLKKILEPIFKELLTSNIDETSHFYKLVKNFGIDIKEPNYTTLLNSSLGFLQASFETSSKALGWTLYHLARDQALQNRLRNELLRHFPTKEPPSLEELKNVTLLSQVLEEALRLWTPFPVLVRDIVNPDQFSKFRVVKGGTFLISPYLIHRRGEESEKLNSFVPERFKRSDEKENDQLSDLWQIKHPKYTQFAEGIHRCPGRFFGKQELLINIAQFIMRYKIVLVDPEETKPVDVKFSITLQPKRAIKVKIFSVK